jgi:hypothetical protein
MALSQEVRALLERMNKRERIDDQRRQALEVLSQCARYLDPNAVVMWSALDAMNGKLLRDDQQGDAAANRQRVDDWVIRGWSRARVALEPLVAPSMVEKFVPPTELWSDLHPLFLDFVKAKWVEEERARITDAVVDLRRELGPHRYKLGRYFVWLEGELQKYWEKKDARDLTISPAVRLALLSYEWICSEQPELAPDDTAKYSREQWEYINEHGCPAYKNKEVPSFETWKRYLRTAIQDVDGRKSTPRIGRPHGKSVVSPDEL